MKTLWVLMLTAVPLAAGLAGVAHGQQCFGPVVAGVCHDAMHTPAGNPRFGTPPDVPGRLPGGQCAGPVVAGVCHDAAHEAARMGGGSQLGGLDAPSASSAQPGPRPFCGKKCRAQREAQAQLAAEQDRQYVALVDETAATWHRELADLLAKYPESAVRLRVIDSQIDSFATGAKSPDPQTRELRLTQLTGIGDTIFRFLADEEQRQRYGD
jgi:hypothetical protein